MNWLTTLLLETGLWLDDHDWPRLGATIGLLGIWLHWLRERRGEADPGSALALLVLAVVCGAVAGLILRHC